MPGQLINSGIFVSGTWIRDSNHEGIPDSLNCILDSKAQDSTLLHVNTMLILDLRTENSKVRYDIQIQSRQTANYSSC